jgi:NADP-reducing hydrogenase subunit HndA
MRMKGTVLVVDDDPIVLKSCERILQPEEYEVRTTTSPKEGLSMVKREPYDLVITDIKMPEMDGLEFVRHVKDYSTDISIVMITGYPSQESVKEALRMGIADYLPKPFSPALLIDATQKAVELKKKGILQEQPPRHEDYTEEVAQGLDKIVSDYGDIMGSLIPVLMEAQDLVGYLPPVVQRHIARGLNLPVSEIYGLVSFYPYFSMKPTGKNKIKVCMGTACFVKRAQEIIDRIKEMLNIDLGEVTEDRSFSLESINCLGACGLAPVVIVGRDTYGAIDPVETDKMLENYQ